MENLLKKETIIVELYDSSRKTDWDGYVQRSPQSVLAHTLGWKSVVEETYGHQAFYLMAYRSGSVVGILPLFLIKSTLFGKFLVTSPYLSYGGMICEGEDVARMLTERVERIACENNVDYAEIRNDKQYQCLKHTKTVYCTMMIDLSLGEETIWKSALNQTTRRNIRKARKAGLEIVEGHEYLEIFSDLHAQGMRRLGTPSHSKKLFYNTVKYFPESIVLMARLGKKYVGGIFLIPHKDTVEVPWAPCLKEYSYIRANMFMFWEAVVCACRESFHFLDFGRSKLGSGTFDFKTLLGAKPTQLYYQFYLNRAKQIPNVDPSNSSFKFLIEIWQKLPMPLVKAVGPWIIRDIP